MFDQSHPREKSDLEKAIHALHEEMSNHSGDSEEYAKMVRNLETLYRLRENDIPAWRPSADVVVTAAANVFAVALIVNFERTGVLTSKALSLLGKLW